MNGPVLILLSIAGAGIALAGALVRSAARQPVGLRARMALVLAGALSAIALLCLALVVRGPIPSRDRTIFIEGSEIKPSSYVNGIRRYSPSQSIRDVKTTDGRPVYDVTYTTDASSNRITPDAPDRPAVVFFG